MMIFTGLKQREYLYASYNLTPNIVKHKYKIWLVILNVNLKNDPTEYWELLIYWTTFTISAKCIFTLNILYYSYYWVGN